MEYIIYIIICNIVYTFQVYILCFAYKFFAEFISSENSIIEVGISIGSFIVGIISRLTCGLLCSIMFKLVQKKQLKYKQTPLVPIYEDTSDVLEHKWRASLKTILFLYE